MNKLEVGMYVRTKNGIGKVTECRKHDKWGYIIKILGKYSCFTHTSNKELSDVIKASFNIIDLIEVGDYVNGSKVIKIENVENYPDLSSVKIEKSDFRYGIYETVFEKDIKSIVTKEQFESVSYRIGE